MRMVMISEVDAQQVAAILNTHAEMQDQRTVGDLETIGRLQVEVPEDAVLTISNLKDHVQDCEKDCDNLRRIAKIFI